MATTPRGCAVPEYYSDLSVPGDLGHPLPKSSEGVGYSSGSLRHSVRRTKILATIGPSSQGVAGVRRILRAGANGIRLNLSHGTSSDHRQLLRAIHRAAAQERVEIAVLADVQGPKLRLGEIAGGSVSLARGQRWTIDRNPRRPGGPRRVGAEIPGFSRSARPGDPVILGDGLVELEVESATPTEFTARVVSPGTVRSRSGIYLPRSTLRPSVLGAKDRRDLEVAVAAGIDFLGLSFVRSARDVRAARSALDRAGGKEVRIVAKIERAEALDHLDEIVGAADGLMVARGDLGIELPLERLALEQKRLIRVARAAGIVSIVATQMLLSMVHAPRPTRAEATDVANAVLDGADALMLSEETAVGDYPAESVAWLARIAESTEPALPRPALLEAVADDADRRPEAAVAHAAVDLANRRGAVAIVTPTHSGRTARLVARLVPTAPVLALSSRPSTRRALALTAGVLALPAPMYRRFADLRIAAGSLVERQIHRVGPVVLTAGFPIEGRPTNLITVVDPWEMSQRPARRKGQAFPGSGSTEGTLARPGRTPRRATRDRRP